MLSRLQRSDPKGGTLLSLLALACAVAAHAQGSDGEEVYQAPEAFVAESFAARVAEPAVLWLSRPMREAIKEILGHEYPAMRVRYWRAGDRTAWVLDEIGKVKPITTGIVVDEGRVARLEVLIYRESHGWEVKHPFFTDRFRGVEPGRADGLSQPIDNIAGATLSVNALKRLAALALYLDGQVRKKAR